MRIGFEENRFNLQLTETYDLYVISDALLSFDLSSVRANNKIKEAIDCLKQAASLQINEKRIDRLMTRVEEFNQTKKELEEE